LEEAALALAKVGDVSVYVVKSDFGSSTSLN